MIYNLYSAICRSIPRLRAVERWSLGSAAAVCVFGGILSVGSGAYAQASFPYCQSTSADSDGDGWGWENSASCIIVGSPIYVARLDLPDCSDPQSDSDGDGYGFENGKSCLVVKSNTKPSNQAESASKNEVPAWVPSCESSATDPDGDGYGFEYGRSCANRGSTSTKADTNTNTNLPVCKSSGSDLDGDGYGWENNQSCIASSGTSEIKVPTVSSFTSGAFAVGDITDVVLVTGQSNVLASNTAYDNYLDAPNAGVFAYTSDGWQVADLHQTWDRFLHPGNQSLDTPGRLPTNSFALHFGKSLVAADSSRVVAFIVVPGPGEGISNWDKGTAQYERITQKVTQALADIPHKKSIDAVLWHQGENDWLYEGTADANPTGFTSKDSDEYRNYYQIKLDALIANFRNESWGKSNTAFICGETRRAEGVNRRLMALNSDTDSRTACVSATDLPKRADDQYGSHFSAEGLRTLGSRYAEAFFNMN